jgi:glycosyltransferase involved in cell wall biosynthesis
MEPKAGEFIFFPGRLHHWKRPDLIIAAMKYVSYDVKLLIAGIGEDEARLKELAKGDDRVQFVGRVDDDRLVDLYSRAIAVPFVPINEDYGLITIEAFKSKKPVITCKDSGEPAVIVKDGITGFVVEPDPRKIAEKINYLIEHPSEASKMGEIGFESVRDITWDNIVSELIGSAEAKPKRIGPEIKVLVTDMQPIEPAIGGGRLRLKGLYSNFNENFNVQYVGSYDWQGEKYREIKISNNLLEIDVPFSHEHFEANNHINKLVPSNNIIDVLSPFLIFMSEGFVKKVQSESKNSDVIIVSHPWIYTAIFDMVGDKYLIYDSHNYEYGLRKQLFPSQGFGKCIVEYVRFIEQSLCQHANLILACSDEDKKSFIKHYHVDENKILVVPNGTFTNYFNNSINKDISKKSLSISDFSTVFVGSDYPPNRDAAEFIIKDLAKKMPDVQFVIVGGVSSAFNKSRVPNNVLIFGSYFFITSHKSLMAVSNFSSSYG